MHSVKQVGDSITCVAPGLPNRTGRCLPASFRIAHCVAGIRGLIYDKDNTLTAPYVDEVHPVVAQAFQASKDVFGDRILVLSNSAGTADDEGK